jgi:hypothetical protein
MVTQEAVQYTMAIVASFGAFSGLLLPLVKDWREEHLRKPKEAGKYFEELAIALTDIVTELKDKRVPRINGTHLNGLLQDFAAKTKSIKSTALPPKLNASLLGAAKAAKTLDAWALDSIQLEDDQRMLLLAHLERAAGTCKTLASKF